LFVSHSGKPLWRIAGAVSVTLILSSVGGELTGLFTMNSGPLFGEVLAIQPERFYRFYQHPPQSFERLNAGILVSVTNRAGRPLYTRGYSVKALAGKKWSQFKNANALGVDPYSFGLFFGDHIQDLDLSRNGFDYVTSIRPLADNEDFEGWMFGESDTPVDPKSISKFQVTLYDSTETEYVFVSRFPTRRGTTITVPKQLAFGPTEVLLPELPKP
jgi:hypothetical protein